jgi:hypothetical protein
LCWRIVTRPCASADIGIFQSYHHLGVVVLTMRMSRLLPTRPAIKTAPEKGFKEITGIAGAATLRTIAGELKTSVPVWRRTEILPSLPVAAQLVISSALFEIFQDGIGFTQLLEADFGIRVLADIGMIFARQRAVGALDFILAGIARHAHDLVVVLEFHLSALLA